MVLPGTVPPLLFPVALPLMLRAEKLRLSWVFMTLVLTGCREILPAERVVPFTNLEEERTAEVAGSRERDLEPTFRASGLRATYV